MSLVISGGAVVTMDDQATVHNPGWVFIEDDRLRSVGSGDPPPADDVIDATGMAVMPGMVNGHTHLFQTFLRGLADDKPLLEWLADCIWPSARHFTAADAEAAATIGLIENLRSGATSVIDHQYIHPDPDIDDAVCRAAERLGVRFLLARGWADRNYDPPLMESTETIIERTGAVVSRWQGAASGRIRVEFAPLIPWGCSDQAMAATVAASRSFGAGTHIHCAETSIEVEMNLEERGTRHVHWLEDLSVLGPDTQLVHSVWLDDSELDLIAARDAVVVHCPTSNMYLASGIARIVDMRSRGIRVALASDGPGSNNRQDMFEAMKNSVLLQKVATLDAMALQPEDALWMATRGGAAALGMEGEVGVLAPGYKADLVTVRLDSPFVAPVHRVQSALVFNASPADVSTVIVDGRIVIREGRLQTADEAFELGQARVRCEELMKRSGVNGGR
ncbi:MAG: amidohydrolase [Acidimicrobiia bacterium]|nr:amidohydrolase [Acidimicrobiia bacterium]